MLRSRLSIACRAQQQLVALIFFVVCVGLAGYHDIFNIRTKTTLVTRTALINHRIPSATSSIARPAPTNTDLRRRFRSNGLLEFTSGGKYEVHPIHDLILYAHEKWQRKLNRASKTLEQAVAEYQRRYGRYPPRGFDKWWDYARRHDVQLPDEYDQIFRDLQPFWGMSSEDLTRIEREFEGHNDSYTLGKGPSLSNPDADSTVIQIVNFSLPADKFDLLTEGAFDVIASLKDVEEHIPTFRAVFIPHDNPEHAFDWEVKQLALGHAAEGTHMDAFNTLIPTKYDGWISSCDPLSPAWSNLIDFSAPPAAPQTKSFIFDHRKAMDPCQHPTILRSHGQFLPWGRGPIPNEHLTPSFAYSPSMMHQDITLAHTVAWRDSAKKRQLLEWDDKKDDRLEWRGRNTGIWFGGDFEWRQSQRARLMEWANGDEGGLSGNVTVLIDGEEVLVDRTLYAPAMLDIGFIDGPHNQCEEDICPKLLELYDFHRRPHSQMQASRYKYILDVDGNAWSSRFHRLMSTTNSLIFKSTVYPEWWADRVQPWVHYVPVQNDLSDLWDSLVFFRGGLDGRGRHETEAKRIARDGKEWAQRYWRKEDMTAYNFRLFLEYARVMSPNRTQPEWSYQH